MKISKAILFQVLSGGDCPEGYDELVTLLGRLLHVYERPIYQAEANIPELAEVNTAIAAHFADRELTEDDMSEIRYVIEMTILLRESNMLTVSTIKEVLRATDHQSLYIIMQAIFAYFLPDDLGAYEQRAADGKIGLKEYYDESPRDVLMQTHFESVITIMHTNPDHFQRIALIMAKLHIADRVAMVRDSGDCPPVTTANIIEAVITNDSLRCDELYAFWRDCNPMLLVTDTLNGLARQKTTNDARGVVNGLMLLVNDDMDERMMDSANEFICLPEDSYSVEALYKFIANSQLWQSQRQAAAASAAVSPSGAAGAFFPEPAEEEDDKPSGPSAKRAAIRPGS